MVDNLNKTENKISLGSFLVKFFASITIGGIFLSVGLIGVYRLIDNRPMAISNALVITSLIIGLFLDGAAILYFLKSKKHLFDELEQDNK